MSIRDIENSIINKLKESFPDFLVQGFPEKPQEFILLHPIGAILVHYRGGNYSNTDAINFISQEKKLDFAITIVTRNLRSNNGAYEVLDLVKQTLCGFKPEYCSKLTPVKEGFLSETTGVWQYEISFTLSTPSVEDRECTQTFENEYFQSLRNDPTEGEQLGESEELSICCDTGLQEEGD